MKNLAVIFTVICATIVSTKTQAQMSSGDLKFGVGLHLGLPVGDFHQTNSFGIGVQAQGEYAFSENITGVATTGYTSFFGKTATFNDGFGDEIKVKAPSVGLIPILVGPRFYPAENFFVGAQIGLGILTGNGSTSAFDYYPQVGYNAESFQAILGYNGLSKNGSSLGHIGLTFLYKFGGNK